VPPSLDVHVILDNYGTHKTPLIHRWVVRHPWTITADQILASVARFCHRISHSGH